jgi:hypothetical protein
MDSSVVLDEHHEGGIVAGWRHAPSSSPSPRSSRSWPFRDELEQDTAAGAPLAVEGQQRGEKMVDNVSTIRRWSEHSDVT